MFVNRANELKALGKRLESNKFELIIIYGRRRIGKTTLILESAKNTEHIYYLAVEGDNIHYFKKVIARFYPEVLKLRDDWEIILNFLKNKIVIIDEFPNLIADNPIILSLFQRIIDTELSKTKTKLILLGSSVSMMGEKVLPYKSPIYGRKTAVLKLKPVKFLDLAQFFPSASMEELVEIYGFADGIPYYLRKIQPPFWDWLDTELKMPDTFLKYEVDFLMKYEFRDVSTYKKILEAVAYGKRTPKEIRDYLGLRHSDISPYINNLIKTEFLKRKIPIKEKAKSKKGRYFLNDNFLAFWFRFIAPNLSSIEEGIFDINCIKEDYPSYLGTVFEKAAMDFLIELNKENKLPFKFNKFGGWWHKGEEIDLVLLNERIKSILFIEVKWKSLRNNEVIEIIKNLEEKVERVEFFEDYEKYYGVIAKKTEASYHTGYQIYNLSDFRREIH